MKLKVYAGLGYYSNDPDGKVSLRITDRASRMGVIDVELTPQEFRNLLAGTNIELEGRMSSIPELFGRDNTRWRTEVFNHEPSAEEVEDIRRSFAEDDPTLEWLAGSVHKKETFKPTWAVRFDGYAPREENE